MRIKQNPSLTSSGFLFFMNILKGGVDMKEKLYAIFFAAAIAVMGYIMLSTAAAHTARDTAELYQWQREYAVRP